MIRLHLPTCLLAAGLLTATASRHLSAQTLTPADSTLIYRILSAEDRRDARDSSLWQGARHTDVRIVQLAERALARTTDSTFAERRHGRTYAPRLTWPLPSWRARYDSVRVKRNDCVWMETALQDSAWQVRIRAADLASDSCAEEEDVAEILMRMALELPGATTARTWQVPAHALVAIARLRPDEAHGAIRDHPVAGARVYIARAAAAASDTATLRQLVGDRDDNVKEAAIAGLSRLTGHADDVLFQRALNASGAQAVRAAAMALTGSTHPGTPRALDRTLRRWLRRPNDSERDVRLALLAAAGRPASEDRHWNAPAPLPMDVVPLALGADVRLRVTMARESGGESFIVKLRGDVAPITAARILELARHGYYDGTQWHRVESNFVLQGGGPGANEYVGHPQFFRDELGTVSHLRGGVGMSTRGHDTGDAQWFFDLGENSRLDRDFTLFAEVMEGMRVVDDIMEGAVIRSIRPLP